MKRLTTILIGVLACWMIGSAEGAPRRGYRVDEIPNVQRADRTKFVSNPDGILTPQAVARIDSICYQLRHRNIAQVAVVAVDRIASDDMFDFGYELFSSWGVGRKETDNGLGILLVKERREIRFMTGYGLEGVLPDAICKRIQTKYMLPYFREGDYSAGMVAGMEAVDKRLTGSELDLGGTDDFEGDDAPLWLPILIVLTLVLLPVVMAIISEYRRSKCPVCKLHTLKFKSDAIIERTRTYTVHEKTYVCSNCGHVEKRRSRNDRGGGGGMGGGLWWLGGMGGFGGGRSGGIGGGFGGGGFGGGGAGSRW